MAKSTATNLSTRIHEDIENGNYECVVCVEPIRRKNQVWTHDGGCWGVTHLKCVKKWFYEVGMAWRCPACNCPIDGAPSEYRCWCGKEPNPTSVPGIPPHSCGQTCGKPRAKGCPHPCPLQCHAGPCPPCTAMSPASRCYCGKRKLAKRCIEIDWENWDPENGWSCGAICGDLLTCGEHECPRPCHPGLCGRCELPVGAICYCGKVTRSILMSCSRRKPGQKAFKYFDVEKNGDPSALSAIEGGFFNGSFDCGMECGRLLDCGVHKCERTCHAQDKKPDHCPFSPDVINTCPCGRTPLEEILQKPRETCEDEVPACTKRCGKPTRCGHGCSKTCHTDSCACYELVDIACRCGRVVSKSICHQGRPFEPPRCTRACRAQLSCGRHQCGETCCVGEKKATVRKKKKRPAGEEIEAEHICFRTCSRLLTCGTHFCQKTCHRGPCGRCLEGAIFEEIVCHCGKTILEPPQPCGTQPPVCRYPCIRERENPCGHPAVAHTCHPDNVPCPKCSFLVSKTCICGKKKMANQPCWLSDARCGQPCLQKLKCGHHFCKKTCHKAGECEDAHLPEPHCRQPCNRPRTTCDHLCADICHAPEPCNENKPCASNIVILCACQRRKKEVPCQASFSNPEPVHETLECDDECLKLQRNRRLAEALHIDLETHSDDHIPFSTATLKMYAASPSWADKIEKRLKLFAVDAQQKRTRFEPMGRQRRAFLHSLAEDFGFDTISQDPEPHRHVSVFKTPRFVGPPMKTLAQATKLKGKVGATLASGAVGTSTFAAATARRDPYNALLLTGIRFGLTVDELDEVLGAEMKRLESAHHVVFSTTFLPNDEVVIKATAASSTPWRAMTPERVLEEAKRIVNIEAVTLHKLADSVLLCVVDTSGHIARREQGAIGTWNTVVSQGAKRGRGVVAGAGPSHAASASSTPAIGTPPVETASKSSVWGGGTRSRGGAARGGSTSASGAIGGRWGTVGGNGFSSLTSVSSTMPTRSSGFVALRPKKKEKKPGQEPGGEAQPDVKAGTRPSGAQNEDASGTSTGLYWADT